MRRWDAWVRGSAHSVKTVLSQPKGTQPIKNLSNFASPLGYITLKRLLVSMRIRKEMCKGVNNRNVHYFVLQRNVRPVQSHIPKRCAVYSKLGLKFPFWEKWALFRG